MPTPTCHAQGLLSGLSETASDKVALIAAGVVGSTPLWFDAAKQVSEVGAMLGPGLAAALVISKIVQIWVAIMIQIWKAARNK
ncbi:hypothetical protein [Methylosinus sp. PW1]|uniref:hypothetical protein n=1 Tax=Methylosinus sp. PW1 TaxID=107636 RepID=UPI0012EC6341|nr:hypothetical protein [Methylosinus sp. PW1]